MKPLGSLLRTGLVLPSLWLAPLFAGINPAKPNILVVVLDDFGRDLAPGYGGADRPPMPTLDNLRVNGVRFDNVWASPYCSPTRSCLLTGRYGFRTGVGYVALRGSTLNTIADAEPLLPDALASATPAVATGLFGKWHLGSQTANRPVVLGFDRFAGVLGFGVSDPSPAHPGAANYTNWEKASATEGGGAGTQSVSTTYATTAHVNDARAWINQRSSASSAPWLAWLAFTAPHFPYERPPDNLHTYDAQLNAQPNNERLRYLAMCQAADTELGRLLATIPAAERANTMIFVIGDNGTPGEVKTDTSLRGAKGSVYEGGIRVPLVVNGPLVASPGRAVSHLVHATDLFATIMQIHGVSPAVYPGLDFDGVSFRSLLMSATAPATRTSMYTEHFLRGNYNDSSYKRALREIRYKLIRSGSGPDELYDLQTDPDETTNLTSAAPGSPAGLAYTRLKQKMASLLATR